GRGVFVRMRNWPRRSSSPYRAFTSSRDAHGSLICSPIAGRLPPAGGPGGGLPEPSDIAGILVRPRRSPQQTRSGALPPGLWPATLVGLPGAERMIDPNVPLALTFD